MRSRSSAVLLSLALIHLAACGTPPDGQATRAAQPGPAAADRSERAERPKAVFIGSSSIYRWHSLETDFPELDVLNEGRDGALMREIRDEVSERVLPHRPDLVFVYAGSIDLRSGSTPEDVVADFRTFSERVHAELPDATVFYLAAKPSLAKWDTIGLDREMNREVERYARETRGVGFVDTYEALLVEGTPPPARFFVADRNHLSDAGYGVWAEAVRNHLAEASGGE